MVSFTEFTLLPSLLFLFKKINVSTFSGLRQFRFTSVIVPDTENTLSDGTDVAGTHKSCFASFARRGYLSWLAFHHVIGLVLGPSTSFSKLSSSLAGVCTADWLVT